jgi:hypothetical protein
MKQVSQWELLLSYCKGSYCTSSEAEVGLRWQLSLSDLVIIVRRLITHLFFVRRNLVRILSL